MRTNGNILIAGLLSSGLIFGPAFVRAEDSALATQGSSGPSQGELKWREDLKNSKETKSALLVSGGILGIGGAITAVVGNLKAQSAEDIEGCTREGLFTITCRDQKSLDQAQDRIDSGKQLAITGLVVALVGGGLLWGGSSQSSKIDDLEREGRKKGYKLALDQINGGKEVRLLVKKSF